LKVDHRFLFFNPLPQLISALTFLFRTSFYHPSVPFTRNFVPTLLRASPLRLFLTPEVYSSFSYFKHPPFCIRLRTLPLLFKNTAGRSHPLPLLRLLFPPPLVRRVRLSRFFAGSYAGHLVDLFRTHDNKAIPSFPQSFFLTCYSKPLLDFHPNGHRFFTRCAPVETR